MFGSSLVLPHCMHWKNAPSISGKTAFSFIPWIFHKSIVVPHLEVLRAHKNQQHHRAHCTGNFPFGIWRRSAAQSPPTLKVQEGFAGCSITRRAAGFLMEEGPCTSLGNRIHHGFTMDCWICPELTPHGSDHQPLLLKGLKGKLPLGISLILNE